MAVADVFDALTSERPYKQAWPLEKVMEHIHAQAGRHFDVELVECLEQSLDDVLQVVRTFTRSPRMEL